MLASVGIKIAADEMLILTIAAWNRLWNLARSVEAEGRYEYCDDESPAESVVARSMCHGRCNLLVSSSSFGGPNERNAELTLPRNSEILWSSQTSKT